MKTNFLDFIPKRNSLVEWTADKKGIVTLAVKNRGFYNHVAQVLFRRPKVSYISLEEFGSFIWRNIDGEKSVYEIGALVKENFGEKAEPLYERLCAYIKTLRRLEYVVYARTHGKQFQKET